MNGLSLCAGIGGIDLGLSLALGKQYTTVGYVEIDSFCQQIIFERMADGILGVAPVWADLRSFDGAPWRGVVDIVTAGYPCQPFSVAGKRRGTRDPRHLWPHVARVIHECEPGLVFLENVPHHLRLGFPRVARDLRSMGYDVEAGLFTAAEVGASHKRQRLYILARRRQGDGDGDAGRGGDDTCESGRGRGTGGTEASVSGGSGADVGDADIARLEGRREPERSGSDEWLAWPPGPEDRDQWAAVLAERPELAPAVADADGAGLERTPVHLPVWRPHEAVSDADRAGGGLAAAEAPTQPPVRRVAHGLPRRVDRLRALGNAVVPRVAALAFCTLAGRWR